MKLLDGIYCYPWESMTENNCNSFFIDGEVPTLIDPGHAHLLPKLIEGMEEDGVSFQGVRLVINTHGHPDHCEGSEWFKQNGAMVTISKLEDELLRGPMGEMYRSMGMKPPEMGPDFFIQEGRLDMGSLETEIILTPGHTPASACIYLNREKVMIVGDLVFAGGVGRVDLPGGNADMLRESISRISEMDIEHILPGHGPVVSGRERVEENFTYIQQGILPML